MKKRLSLFFFGVILLTFTSGCATMMSGSTQPVTFKSSPNDVTVSIDGIALGKTPNILVIKRKKGSVLEFTKDGYTKQTLKMDTKMNGWLLANAIFCLSCVFSTTTDYSSGAAYEYAPNIYFVSLVPEGVTETPSDIKKRKVKSFIVGNYNNIVSSLNKTSPDSGVSKSSKRPGTQRTGPSEHLKTLFVMLEIPEAERESARSKIKNISSDTKEVLSFADKVINAFVQ
ncbi:MAG: hypothetical protein GXO96_05330 [Nitrospirae bacterium]|nr:hypothetical protein [Candidatus Manganitrophaceae bacterium]